MKFTDFPYTRPNKDEVIAQIDKLTEQFKASNSFEEQLNVYKELEALSSKISTMGSISHVRYTVNTKDEFYSEEKKFFDGFRPLLQEKFLGIQKLIFNSKYKEDFKKEIGEIFFTNMELDLKSFSSEVVTLAQEENELKSQYQKLYGSATVEFDGKTLPLPMLGPYKESPDREIRKSALEVEGKFFDEHQEELDEIFDKLVKNRAEQAKVLGFKNFVELAYARMTRNCYTPDDVANFRKQILEDVVPLVNKIKEVQKKRIGVDKIKAYDNTYLFNDGNPTPKGTVEEQLEHTKTMYRELSPETAEFIDFMFESELFDLVSKDGKAPGGYCTSFAEYKAPFIFSNFNGTSGDVDVLTHEAGHAFAGYLSMRNIAYSDVRSPSMEGCEVHSMAMEVLTEPWHHLFFKEDTTKYTLAHTESDLAFLPYGTMVDYFQHIIYENPDMTPSERNAKWAELESKFRPSVDFEGIPFYGRGAGWQRQLHVYLYPFYYIDYVLASTVALQIHALCIEDNKKAWETYMNFTKKGGTMTFIELVESSGLMSPMKDGCLKATCAKISDWLFGLYSK